MEHVSEPETKDSEPGLRDGAARRNTNSNDAGESEEGTARGYPKLAHFMSRNPETIIFRRFRSLALLNILRLQAELQSMEMELMDTIADDAKSGDAERESYCLDFNLMRDMSVPEEGGDVLQYQQLKNIGSKLQEYSEHHLSHSRTSR